MVLETLIAVSIYACAMDYFRQDDLQKVSAVQEQQFQAHTTTAMPYKQKNNLLLSVSSKSQNDDTNPADLSGESIFAKDDGKFEEWAKWLKG